MALIQVTPEVLNSKATEVRNLRSQHDDTSRRWTRGQPVREQQGGGDGEQGSDGATVPGDEADEGIEDASHAPVMAFRAAKIPPVHRRDLHFP